MLPPTFEIFSSDLDVLSVLGNKLQAIVAIRMLPCDGIPTNHPGFIGIIPLNEL